MLQSNSIMKPVFPGIFLFFFSSFFLPFSIQAQAPPPLKKTDGPEDGCVVCVVQLRTAAQAKKGRKKRQKKRQLLLEIFQAKNNLG